MISMPSNLKGQLRRVRGGAVLIPQSYASEQGEVSSTAVAIRQCRYESSGLPGGRPTPLKMVIRSY